MAKKILISIAVVIGIGTLAALIYFSPYILEWFKSTLSQQTVIEKVEGNEEKYEINYSDEELDELLANENFVNTFNSFYYPDSEIKDVKQVENDEGLFFIVLEIEDNFNNVEDYYKDKNVQSVWTKSAIFETSKEDVEDEFLNSEDDTVPTSKFTYYSLDESSIVNVLIKGLDESKIEIIIIYWELK